MKTELKKELSKISDFENPRISLEQYRTPPALAADLLHTAYMQGDIEGQKVADLGAGTGMLSIGAALLGAEVTAVEKEDDAVRLLHENLEKMNIDIEVIQQDIEDFELDVDTVLMNPPFSHHSDIGLKFWEKALEHSNAVYGISPRGMRERIKDFAGKSSHEVLAVEEFSISLPPSYGFHTEESHETEIDLIITRRKE
ncbi:METTL5 family protein [Candidatus Nanohalovita haloferacivicina]|uniref:METTL5 family protein n=1 Tax=Candidatus Nanohalovita haloferacivicina TaxID=2978046 RepID=UPI00325FC098|nr:Putative methylase [Candidatus Nanohalobia archaeon BNXNv]